MNAPLNAERLRSLLHYDPETGVFRWRESRGPNARQSAAGTMTAGGYIIIWIDYRQYSAHRLAWFYVHGEWPALFIDHINRQKSDNRIANLRQADATQNSANRTQGKRNKSGFKGVHWHKKDRVWVAEIAENKRSRHLGCFSTPEAAAAAYDARAAAIYGEHAFINNPYGWADDK